MADKKITQFNNLPAADGGDLLAIVDLTGVAETKKIAVGNLMGTPGPIGATSPDSGTFTAFELATGPPVNEISTDGNLGNNDDVLPTQNAIKTYVDNTISAIINPRHVSSDSTAFIGDVMLVDTTGGDVSIELVNTPKGTISIVKISSDENKVFVIAQTGTVNGESEITNQWESYTYVSDTINFYTV